MEYMVYFKADDKEYSLKYESEFRKNSKENQYDAEMTVKKHCQVNNLDTENIEIVGTKNITKRKRSEATKTSTESKMRWENKAYRKYTVGLKDKKYIVRLRNEDDVKLIEYIESQKKNGIGTTELVRCALNVLKECEIDRQN